jgi:hypothetical protein
MAIPGVREHARISAVVSKKAANGIFERVINITLMVVAIVAAGMLLVQMSVLNLKRYEGKL